MELPQDDEVTLSGAVTQTKESAETAEITAADEAATLPDLSKAKNADEALALLIKDKGFRECVRYAIDIVEEDSAETVLKKL